jgi:hypothetical protein
MTLSNQGQSTLQWSAGNLPGGVSLIPSSGTIPANSSVSVEVRVSQAGSYGLGPHNLGTLTITATDEEGAPIDGSPAPIGVTLLVANLSHQYLPAITR